MLQYPKFIYTQKNSNKSRIIWGRNKTFATKEIGLELNADKIKYVIMSRDQNAGQSYSMKTDNSSIERMEEFKYLGTRLTNQNSIQEEIKNRLKLGNACYYSVQNLLPSSLLPKK